MKLTIEISDQLAKQLAQSSPDLSRLALEALVVELFRIDEITMPQLKEALGFTSRNQVDGLLKKHRVFEPYTMVDLQKERQTLDKLGL